MVGSDLRTQLKEADADVVAVGRAELDVTDRDAVLYLMKNVRPQIVVNCAAFTKVDACESEEERATEVNGTAVGHLAEGCNRWSALLLQISTDFVFDGASVEPYEINHPVAPISAYGRSKLEGEREAASAWKHQIVRTSWLFGTHGWNFVEAIRRQIDNGRRELKVVDDQRGRPTYTPHLASALIRLGKLGAAAEEAQGTFHYADDDACSWFDFATAIVEKLDGRGELPEPVVVSSVTSAEFASPARRPAWSVLSTERYERLTGARPESWREGLDEYLERRTLG